MVTKKLLDFTSKIFDKGFTELASVPFNNFVFMSKQIPSLLKLKSYQVSIFAWLVILLKMINLEECLVCILCLWEVILLLPLQFTH